MNSDEVQSENERTWNRILQRYSFGTHPSGQHSPWNPAIAEVNIHRCMGHKFVYTHCIFIVYYINFKLKQFYNQKRERLKNHPVCRRLFSTKECKYYVNGFRIKLFLRYQNVIFKTKIKR